MRGPGDNGGLSEEAASGDRSELHAYLGVKTREPGDWSDTRIKEGNNKMDTHDPGLFRGSACSLFLFHLKIYTSQPFPQHILHPGISPLFMHHCLPLSPSQAPGRNHPGLLFSHQSCCPPVKFMIYRLSSTTSLKCKYPCSPHLLTS